MRIGIIGTGRIAGRFIKELVAYVHSKDIIIDDRPITVTIGAVVNPHIEHASEFIAQCGGQTGPDWDNIAPVIKATPDIDTIEDDIDAVYIASPHGTHYEYALKALSSGKHVLCEKPLSFKPDQVRELYEIATKRGLIFMEAIKTAYCPGFRQIEEIVRSGTIGEVKDIDTTFTRLIPYDPSMYREYSDKMYGGAFTEFGSYTMLPVFRFLGTSDHNVRFMSTLTESGVDGYTRTVFDFGDRFAACSTGLTVKKEGQMIISGTSGYILVPSPWWLTRYFEVRFEDPARVERYECEFKGDGLRYEISEFVNRIGGRISNFETEAEEAMARAEVYSQFLEIREINQPDKENK